jgi:hypothetical protein
MMRKSIVYYRILSRRIMSERMASVKTSPVLRFASGYRFLHLLTDSYITCDTIDMMRKFGESDHFQLDPAECQKLADSLGDTPETVISVHLLKRGLCRAYLAGNLLRFDGAIIQALDFPDEPMGFGKDAAVLWNLLRVVQGWACVNVTPTCAPALGSLIQAETGTKVRYYGDIYHTLTKPIPFFHHDAVRQLTLSDLPLLEAAPREVRGSGFGSTHTLLAEGVVAAAIVENHVVAIAHTSARSQHLADIGVSTLAGWRIHGFATAAAAIVAREVQKAGQKPVWSTGEDNYASLRVAQKLGFTRVAQRIYIILDHKSS